MLLAGILLVSFVYLLENRLCAWSLRLLPSEISLLADEFTVVWAGIVPRGTSEEIRVYANLSRPIELEGRTMLPFGTPGSLPGGAFKFVAPLGDAFQYCLMTLVLLLAWPAATFREFIIRIVLSLPLLALLQMSFACVLVSQLWHGVRYVLGVPGPSAWTVWGDLLVGGGGWVLAILMGGMGVAAGRRVSGGATQKL